MKKHLKNLKLSPEQNYNMIDGISNNALQPVLQEILEKKPKDRIKEPLAKRRIREHRI